jgi:hypothetical protein
MLTRPKLFFYIFVFMKNFRSIYAFVYFYEFATLLQKNPGIVVDNQIVLFLSPLRFAKCYFRLAIPDSSFACSCLSVRVEKRNRQVNEL